MESMKRNNGRRKRKVNKGAGGKVRAKMRKKVIVMVKRNS
jgi:hypothetical protein